MNLVGGWIDGFSVVAGWWDGFRVAGFSLWGFAPAIAVVAVLPYRRLRAWYSRIRHRGPDSVEAHRVYL